MPFLSFRGRRGDLEMTAFCVFPQAVKPQIFGVLIFTADAMTHKPNSNPSWILVRRKNRVSANMQCT
jgi:hypothetical protein